jgi:peptidoglycan/LPS O-acetylase OafA/YrhL
MAAPSSSSSLARRLSSPGILRLYLASAVVWEHLMGGGLGTLSVYVFFVLSGYWIGLLWKVKYSRCRRPYLVFMISRFWRLWPVYIVNVLLAILCHWRFSRWWHSWASVQFRSPLWLLNTFLMIGSAAQPHLLTTFWSLDIEVQFYFVAPLVVALSGVFGKSWVQRLAVILACAIPYFALPLMDWLWPYLIFFVAGCALEQTRWNPPRWLVACCTPAAIAVYVITAGLGNHFWLPEFQAPHWRIAPLCCVGLALPFVALCLQRRSDPADRTMGDLAYPLYLFHFIPYLIIDPVESLHRLPFIGRAAINLTVTTIGTCAIYFLIDRPIDRLRSRWVDAQVSRG